MAENQRGRIFGAMVASVAELGYDETGVAEISEISGVSTRSFYNLFPGGKEECFLIVLDQILDQTLAALSAAGEEEEDWEERLAAIYARFAQMVANQPAAATLVLTEAHAAGPAARKALDRATGAFERLSRRRLEESPERSGLPAAMVQAQVGTLQELARTRLRRGEAAALPALMPELVDLVTAYRPPPARLRLATRRPAVDADGIASSDEAERAIRGFTLAVAEHGYSGATIHQIARLGSMSPNTFYANFRDKREVMLAAIDTSTAQLQAFAMAAYRRGPGWAAGVRAAIGSGLGFLASRPATAHLLLDEIYAGGPEALRARGTGVRELTGLLTEGTRVNPGVPAIATEAISGAIVALIRRQLLRKGAPSLPSLAPVASYIALSPFLGPEAACEVASGDGRARHDAVDGEAKPTDRATRAAKWVITGMLGQRWARAEDLGDELGLPTDEILGYLRELEEMGMVERIGSEDGGPPVEWTNVKKARLIDDADWAALPQRERLELATHAAKVIISDLDEAMRTGTLAGRLDEHYTRIHMDLDQEGWRDMGDIHWAAFTASEAARARSERRLRESGEKGIPGSSVQYLIERAPDQGSASGP